MNAPLRPLELLAILLSLIFLCLIYYSLSTSPTGPFPSYPHSGFTPDCPTPAPHTRTNPQTHHTAPHPREPEASHSSKS